MILGKCGFRFVLLVTDITDASHNSKASLFWSSGEPHCGTGEGRIEEALSYLAKLGKPMHL